MVARLRSAGHEALFAGGCVRDLLLEREPEDYDVATSAKADEVEALFDRTVGVGAQFGVVKVLGGAGETEVATFRSDGSYLDHRRPSEICFTDAKGDASRRDFTINGMFLDPTSGDVLDFVGGRQDLAAGVIRAIGDPGDRIAEDRLRLLRAVRFAARFGFRIEVETWQSLKSRASSIRDIAWERIGDEITKILREGEARRGFELLADSGLLEFVLPEVAAMRGVEQSPDHHPEGDVFVHTMMCLEKLDPKVHGGALALAVLLHDVAKPMTAETRPDGRITFYGHCEKGAEVARDVCRRLRQSGETTDRVVWLVANHLRHLQAPEMRVAKLKRFLGEPWIEDLLALIRIDVSSGSGDLKTWQFCVEKLRSLPLHEVRPPPLLRGKDLIELGHEPGPSFKSVLDAAYDAQLEGVFGDRETAREWVAEHFLPAPRRGDTTS